jgi:hypothetical protein
MSRKFGDRNEDQRRDKRPVFRRQPYQRFEADEAAVRLREVQEAAWRTIVVRGGPFVPEIVFQSEQCFDQPQARNAIESQRLEHGPNISK